MLRVTELFSPPNHTYPHLFCHSLIQLNSDITACRVVPGLSHVSVNAPMPGTNTLAQCPHHVSVHTQRLNRCHHDRNPMGRLRGHVEVRSHHSDVVTRV